MREGRRWDYCRPWGFQRCERNWGQDSSLHISPVYGSRRAASIWCSGLKGRASGPGTAAAKDHRDSLAPRDSPGSRLLSPLSPLLSGLKRLRDPLPGLVEDLLARAPQHPAQTRGQLPQSRSQHPTSGLVLQVPPPVVLGPRPPHLLLCAAAAGLARPRARATASLGDPAHDSPRLQERGWPEPPHTPIG